MEANVLGFLNTLEMYKIAMKNMHWDSKSMSEHKLWDEILSYVTEQQDEIAEVAQGILGNVKRNELKPEHYNITNSKKALNDLLSDVENFLKEIQEEKYVGLKSVIESFIGELNKYVYLMDFCLKEDIKRNLNKNKIMEKKIVRITEQDIRNMINETVANIIKEEQGRASQQMVNIINQIKAFEDSNHIIYQSPHPSSTEAEAKKYISQARDLLSRAAMALKSLGY